MYGSQKLKFVNITNMFNCCTTLLLIIIIILPEPGVTLPQIFDESYSDCEIDFGLSDGKKLKKILFPDKLWNVTTSDSILYFSFCKTLQTKCQNQTSSCLINRSNNQMIDLGHEFQMVDENILESIKGAKCPHSSGTYTLTVNFECSDTIKPIPRLTNSNEDSCSYEISIMRPDCQPKCTNVIRDRYMIDLRRFPKNIDVDSNSKKFSLSLCGFSNKCRPMGACEILNDTVVPLALTESQLIKYDVSKNELTARGRYKFGRSVRELNVLIKCDWETELSNVTYKKPARVGKSYKFELESSFGCVKLPQNCFVTSIDNLQYDLSKIYNPNGWKVANVSNGDITLNLCGTLQNPPNTICSNQYSQVCHKKGDQYINRGSILLPLSVDDDVVKATFSSGSRCKENTNFTYNTAVKLSCSKIEKGPILKDFQNCTTLVQWETPHACPIYFHRGQNCIINDRFGNRKLQNLFTESDKSVVVSDGVKLYYNLCGPLHNNCSNFNNVSFCLKNNQNQDVIIGWDNREIISDKGALRLDLSGNKCLNSDNHGKVTVNFICNYEQPSPPPQINIIQDDCIFNMSVFTSLACLSEYKFYDCVHTIRNVTYDLSTLSYKDRNHIIQDGNIEYILNVCGPIVTSSDALCRSNSMICLRNKTEINIKHQYISLGSVAKPSFDNNSLIIEAHMGTYCKEGGGHYKSIIHFECSQERLSPVFLSKDFCTYNFLWKTPEACPIANDCVINDLKSETLLNLTNLQEKEKILKVNLPNGDSHYEFHLCRDVYKKYANGIGKVYRLDRKFYYANKTSYLTLEPQQTNSECKSNNKVNKVILELHCDGSTATSFEEKAFENCQLQMIVRTNIICANKKEHFEYEMEPPRPLESQADLQVIPTTERIIKDQNTERIMKENKCLVVSQNTGYELKLAQLKSQEIVNGTDKYLINFDGKLSCSGFFCKNNEQLLETDTCPAVSIDNENDYVRLHYLTELPCGHNAHFQFEVLLKCLQSKSDLKIVKNSSCDLTVDYFSSEICSLFPEKTVPLSNSALVGGITGGVLIIIALICCSFYFIRGRRLPYAHISCSSDKSSVPIYRRNCRE